MRHVASELIRFTLEPGAELRGTEVRMWAEHRAGELLNATSEACRRGLIRIFRLDL